MSLYTTRVMQVFDFVNNPGSGFLKSYNQRTINFVFLFFWTSNLTNLWIRLFQKNSRSHSKLFILLWSQPLGTFLYKNWRCWTWNGHASLNFLYWHLEDYIRLLLQFLHSPSPKAPQCHCWCQLHLEFSPQCYELCQVLAEIWWKTKRTKQR